MSVSASISSSAPILASAFVPTPSIPVHAIPFNPCSLPFPLQLPLPLDHLFSISLTLEFELPLPLALSFFFSLTFTLPFSFPFMLQCFFLFSFPLRLLILAVVVPLLGLLCSILFSISCILLRTCRLSRCLGVIACLDNIVVFLLLVSIFLCTLTILRHIVIFFLLLFLNCIGVRLLLSLINIITRPLLRLYIACLLDFLGRVSNILLLDILLDLMLLAVIRLALFLGLLLFVIAALVPSSRGGR
mmetsp:Transcript_47358/g.119304  ORF Transcript_47358/g.119304 Transcript_47358/m.119304 type:complete len:245 (-) Transcript_47358:310-1044(-)